MELEQLFSDLPKVERQSVWLNPYGSYGYQNPPATSRQMGTPPQATPQPMGSISNQNAQQQQQQQQQRPFITAPRTRAPSVDD